VTASTKVSLYDRKTDKVQRAYSRFQDNAYSAHFRNDGKLIVAGDKTGAVKVFDVQSKAMLRQMRSHQGAVTQTQWSADGLHMLSGGDDKSVRCWDLGTQEEVWKNTNAHDDYVRALCSNPSVPQVWATGGYDHAVKLWDRRQSGSGSVLPPMLHDKPVENMIMTRSGTMLMAAVGNEVKVWDLIAGGKLLHTFSNHQKNISGLCLESGGARMMSCGLDGLVKVYSLRSMQVCHGLRVGAPLMSIALSPDSRKLAMGCVDGTLIVRTRAADARGAPSLDMDASSASVGAAAAVSSGTSITAQDKKFYKGAGSAVSRTADRMIDTERNERLRPYDVHLKDFNYQKALDKALHTHNPLVVVTVLEELCHRSGLTTALQGRDERTLEPLLSFAARYVAHPRYTNLVQAVTHRLVDLYAGVLGHSDSIDELFLKLFRQVRAEMSMQRKMMKVKGTLDGIISTSHLVQDGALGKRPREEVDGDRVVSE
jgi:U3 small nucleolar RNA-associated protein 15